MAKSSSINSTFYYLFCLFFIAVLFNISSHFKLKYQFVQDKQGEELSNDKKNNNVKELISNKIYLNKSDENIRKEKYEQKNIKIHHNKNNFVEGTKKRKKYHINNPEKSNIKWAQFVSFPKPPPYNFPSLLEKQPLNTNYNPIICPNEMIQKLKNPRLSKEDFSWCQWAISPKGGAVEVGKSWGKLGSKKDREKFDLLNCNSVASKKNPSCDDSWGDEAIKNWMKTPLENVGCSSNRKSKLDCFKNDNSDVYCVIENFQLNFAKWKSYKRPESTDSKSFEKNFMSADCNDKEKESGFPFHYLYSSQLSSNKCDYVHNGTVLLYSHDDIRNLGHTLNDIMNVWVMLWLNKLARHSKTINMLNIDSFKLGHNFYDKPNSFFGSYYKIFNNIIKGVDFSDKTLCIQKVLIQPIPPRFFIWESWFVDLPCSFIGPSSLYQRWNMHVRHSYDLLSDYSLIPTNKVFKIMLVVRKVYKNLWGSNRSSRNYLNLDVINNTLHEALRTLSSNNKYELVTVDLSDYSFEQQIKLISETSIMIGMHGAGMASSMHMSIGSKYCCGIIEIYPAGEFTPIKGHGNMARKMGIYFDRLDIAGDKSLNNGAYVPADELAEIMKKMITTIEQKPTCVLPNVINDPYLEDV